MDYLVTVVYKVDSIDQALEVLASKKCWIESVSIDPEGQQNIYNNCLDTILHVLVLEMKN